MRSASVDRSVGLRDEGLSPSGPIPDHRQSLAAVVVTTRRGELEGAGGFVVKLGGSMWWWG